METKWPWELLRNRAFPINHTTWVGWLAWKANATMVQSTADIKGFHPKSWGNIRQLTFKGTTHLVKAKWVVAFITWTHIRETHIRELGKYYWGIRSSILEDSITLSSQLLVVKLFSTTANILQPPFLCKRIIQIYWASNKVSARTGVISSHNSKSHSHGSSKIAINLFMMPWPLECYAQ